MPAYPSTWQLTLNELEDLRQQAQKLLMQAPPHVTVTMPIEANKLLWMLEKLERQVR